MSPSTEPAIQNQSRPAGRAEPEIGPVIWPQLPPVEWIIRAQSWWRLWSSAEDQQRCAVVGTGGFPICSPGGEKKNRKYREEESFFFLFIYVGHIWMLRFVIFLPPPSFLPVAEQKTKGSPCCRDWLKGDISGGSLAEPPNIGSVRINIPQKPGHCF